MISDKEQGILLRTLRYQAVLAVGQMEGDTIRRINESDARLCTFIDELWADTLQQLRETGNEALCEPEITSEFNYQHRALTILGNISQAHEDSRDFVPPGASLQRLQMWDAICIDARGKKKRVEIMESKILPKRVCMAQHAAASSSQDDATETETINKTMYDSKCSLRIGIPHDVLLQGSKIGSRTFDEVREYRIRGVPFFPEHVTYCGKKYKEGCTTKFESFQIEQSMQVLHPSLVRCVAVTRSAPWITIFPYYNGGSLGDLLLKIPFMHTSFTKTMHRLKHGWETPPPPAQELTPTEHSRIIGVVMDMPHIMHALVDGIAAVHKAGILHTDLHPFNVVLDFTPKHQPRVGIIDWGRLLRVPEKRPSLASVFQPEKHPDKLAEAESYVDRERSKRPWLAPELYDVSCQDAYTEASDIYALGYLIKALHEFSAAAHFLWMGNSAHNQLAMDAILYKAEHWMILSDRSEGKSALQVVEFFKTLNPEPSRVHLPQIELSI